MMDESGMSEPYMDPYQMPPQAGITHQSQMRELTDPSKIIFSIRLALMRLYEDQNTGELVKYGKPMLNEKGINDILAIVQSIVNQNNNMSNYHVEEVEAIGFSTAKKLIWMLMTKWREYGISPRYRHTERSQIMEIALNPIHQSLTRGRIGDDKKFFKKTTTEVLTNPKPQEGKGPLGLFK